MGLDMYLYKKTYVQNWDFMTPDELHTVTVTKNGESVIKPERVSYIIEQVAYWRKANAIHKWFVDNVQNGVDECQESYVSKDDLKTLIDLCNQVLNTVETVEGDLDEGRTFHPDGKVEQHTRKGNVVAQVGVAANTLPTQSGFFFGGTNYDEYYLDDLRNTVEQLTPLLTETGGDFYYRASW